METVYEKGIAQLQRKEYEEQLQKKYFERFQWPLGIGLLLLVMEMFVSTEADMNHRDTENIERRMAGVMLALCLCGLTSVSAAESWPRIYNDGVTAYRSNDLATAMAAFERSLASPEGAAGAVALQSWEHALPGWGRWRRRRGLRRHCRV